MSYDDFQTALWIRGEKERLQRWSSRLLPSTSSSLQNGGYLINIVRSWKISPEQRIMRRIRRKSLKTTKDQSLTVLTLFQINNLKPILFYNYNRTTSISIIFKFIWYYLGKGSVTPRSNEGLGKGYSLVY